MFLQKTTGIFGQSGKAIGKNGHGEQCSAVAGTSDPAFPNCSRASLMDN